MNQPQLSSCSSSSTPSSSSNHNINESIIDNEIFVNRRAVIILIFCLYANIILFQNTYLIYNITTHKTSEYNQHSFNECFISIHNFVTVKKLRKSNNYNSTTTRLREYDFDLKTFISSYSKPYMIELLQQSTKDCICCPIQKMNSQYSVCDMT